ncbi:MAG: hypothetical protein BMS9Abin37_1965 [Acidobacteriota bacterium]|nr:MAG: hypothetical protein BMS9Abin37_1965 [Acidobacteriota bacterium]
MWWLACLLLAPNPSPTDAAPWLGRYVAGPETIAFRWDDGLVYHHGNIVIPVDGTWHVTVPEFFVRHRVTWLPEKKALRLEESHDESQPWRHELRLDGERLVKVSLSGGSDGGEIVVRTYEKVKEGVPCTEKR